MKMNSYYQTITFEIENEPGFMVDIVENANEYEAWLYHKDYGVKSLMFGSEKKQHNGKADFCDMVEANLINQPYINNYMEEYMND